MKARLEKGEVKQYNFMPKAFLTVADYLPTIEGHNLDPNGDSLPYVENQVVKDADTLSDDTLKLFGFFDCEIPQYDYRIEELTDFYLDGDVYRRDVVDKDLPLTLSEYKDTVIKNYDHILFQTFLKTDYHYTKQKELGTDIPQDVLESRLKLRDEAKKIKEQIMALKTKKAVLTFDLPNYMRYGNTK